MFDYCSPPSKCSTVFWHVANGPGAHAVKAQPNSNVGKYVIFEPRLHVDETWERVRLATEDGELGFTSKVSTRKRKPDELGPKDNLAVIFVYTKDINDESDKSRVREHLYRLGFSEHLVYRTNEEDSPDGTYVDKEFGGRTSKNNQIIYGLRLEEFQDPDDANRKRIAVELDPAPGPSKVKVVKREFTMDTDEDPETPSESKYDFKMYELDADDEEEPSVAGAVGGAVAGAAALVQPSTSTGTGIRHSRKPSVFSSAAGMGILAAAAAAVSAPDTLAKQLKLVIGWQFVERVQVYVTKPPHSEHRYCHLQQINPSGTDILIRFEQMKTFAEAIYRLGRIYAPDEDTVIGGIETPRVNMMLKFSALLECMAIFIERAGDESTRVYFPQSDFLFYYHRMEFVRKFAEYGNGKYADHGISTDEEDNTDLSDEDNVFARGCGGQVGADAAAVVEAKDEVMSEENVEVDVEVVEPESTTL